MIDIENEVIDRVSRLVRKHFPDVYFTGELVKAPSKFPAVSLIEMDNTMYRRTQSSTDMENHAEVMYEVNVYSNKNTGKKNECRGIAFAVDSAMQDMGFTRVMFNPIPDMHDATIYRIVARYMAVVSANKIIYRR